MGQGGNIQHKASQFSMFSFVIKHNFASVTYKTRTQALEVLTKRLDAKILAQFTLIISYLSL